MNVLDNYVKWWTEARIVAGRHQRPIIVHAGPEERRVKKKAHRILLSEVGANCSGFNKLCKRQ